MKKNRFLLVLSTILFWSCVQEDYFGLSPYGNIKEFEVSNQASQSVIDADARIVTVEMPAGVDISAVAVKKIVLSSFATANIHVGDVVDLNTSVPVQVIAEDGSMTEWTLHAEIASVHPQLPNSDFNLWYKTGGGYYEPGNDATSTIWGTGNPGTALLGKYATTPLETEDDNKAVRMETLDNGKLAGTFGAPISAGSIYTGKFVSENIDPADPEAAIDFGTNFSARPVAFKLKYIYQPGPVNKDKEGNILGDGDQCEMYILLEVRMNDSIKRLATAWFRSDENLTDFKEIQIDFVYGALDGSYPDFMKPKNGEYVVGDDVNYMLPTHITFVASSSFDGANFAGAIGSVLIIDDLELIYE